jgi:hypothetical protein
MNSVIATDEAVLDERHIVLYKVRLSALYHRTRENKFDKWDKSVKFFTVALGAAAISELVGSGSIKDMLVALGAALTASTLVFGVADKARKHADLATQFGNLESEILAQEELTCTPAMVSKWESRLAALEAIEPPSSATEISDCQKRLDRMYA